MVTTCVLVLALLLQAGAAAQAPVPLPDPALVRIFVQTEEGGEGSELADRRQSVKDLASSIAARKKTMAVVLAAEKADLVLDVVDRGVTVPKVVMGLGPRPGDPSSIPGMGTPVRIVVLRARLSDGHQSPIFSNKNKPAESKGGWQSAADDIAGQIEKWVKERRAAILAKRGRLGTDN